MNILCVLLPHFPLECEIAMNPALKGRKALVLYGTGSKKVVLDWSADLEGIYRDMPLQQAMAIDNKVELVQSDLPLYWSAFNRIMDGLESCVSPLVEGTELGVIYLDIDGLQLIYPDNESIVRAVKSVLPDGLSVQMGIACGKFPAYLAAMKSPQDGCLVLADDLQFMGKLSCDVLPVPVKDRTMLHEFGLHTLGQLAGFPAGPLQSQFGPEGIRMRELARGIDTMPLVPRNAEQMIEESLELNSVTTSIDTLVVSVESLLSRIFTRIMMKGMGIHSLELWTRGQDTEYWERAIRFKEPSMDLKNTLLRIRRVLETYPQPGPVEQAGIRVTRLGYPRGKQNSLFREIRGRSHLMEDIRQLELRQGNPQVFTIREVEPWSRIPERRYALLPAGR
ncbi:MAG: hypothetical protein JW712_06445 [Dehalococcoidales bacterium]|nr:hypothetical protein [Dehalococcoidales bacterium]